MLSWRSMYPLYSDFRIHIPSAFGLFCAEIVSRFLPNHRRLVVEHFISGQFVGASWLNLYCICTILRTYMQMQIHSQAQSDQDRRIITGQSALRRHRHRDSIRLTDNHSWWDMNNVSSVSMSSLCVRLLKTGDRRIIISINSMIKYNYPLAKYRYRHCRHCIRILCRPTKVHYRGGRSSLSI